MNFATFDLNLLRVLDALLREGSATRAGARLGLSQSAVSNALGRLRHALGDPLFLRRGNGLVPTDFAAALADPLREELNRLEGLLSPPAAFDPRSATGRFKIAGSDFFADLLMPRLGALLSREAPSMVAHLVDLVPQDYIASLESYDADLALIPDTDLPDWIAREPLFLSSFSVIARAGHPALAGLDDGAQMPLDRFCACGHVLFSPEGNVSAMGDAALARLGRTRRVVMTLPVFSGVCRVVADSDLIALVPTQMAHARAAAGGLRVLAPPMEVPAARIVGIWHRRSDQTPMARWMRRQVFDLLRALEIPSGRAG